MMSRVRHSFPLSYSKGGFVLNRIIFRVLLWSGLVGLFCSPVQSQTWKAGVAARIITPKQPMWTSGYGGMKEPAGETLIDLNVKALALEDARGTRMVIVTSDLVGLNYEFTEAIARVVQKRHSLSRNNLLLTASHTHCGPEMRPFVEKSPGYHYPLIDSEVVPKEFAARIPPYVDWLKGQFIEVIGESLSRLAPAALSFSSIQPVPFAVSRRYPDGKGGVLYRSGPSSYYTGGLRDDTVPVLTVTAPGGGIQAVLFGYACHPITLSENVYSGDYPGFAQKYIEEAFPGAVAMFIQGHGGYLVPNSRFQREYAMGHGRALADAVKKALEKTPAPLAGPLHCGYDEVNLTFRPVPDRAALEKEKTSENAAIRDRAIRIVETMQRGEPIPRSLPCPIQVVDFGKELRLVAISGDVVVDYAVALKAKYPDRFVWAAGYANGYIWGYLPTLTILREGGYESSERFPFGPFTDDVEERVMSGIQSLVRKAPE
jgi:hypothetical protein